MAKAAVSSAAERATDFTRIRFNVGWWMRFWPFRPAQLPSARHCPFAPSLTPSLLLSSLLSIQRHREMLFKGYLVYFVYRK
ncbi:hypothetical protein ACLKA7_009981 [Drosophila subpalustris]